jgi:hypothetical protein
LSDVLVQNLKKNELLGSRLGRELARWRTVGDTGLRSLPNRHHELADTPEIPSPPWLDR